MSDALNASWTAVSELLPRLLGAGLVLFATFLVARLLQRLGARLLRGVGFDDVLERTGSAASLRRVGFAGAPSMLIGYVIFWGVLLAGTAAALSVLGLSSLQENIDLIVVLAGKALVAVLILAGGLAVASWLSNLAAREAEEAGLRGGDLFRRGIFAAVFAVAALLAGDQLGIDISLLVLLAAVFLGTVGLVVALSLGVGLAPLSGNIAAGRYVQGHDLQVGNEISVDGVAGIIENLGYASVTLRSEDGSLHHVPNRVLLEGIITKRPQMD
jgi:Conserved TM helix/Mechanosensitive ion channel